MKPINPIRDIMTTNLVTVKMNTSITTLRELFKKHTFRHLPVMDSNNRLMGIITREDYFKLFSNLAKDNPKNIWTKKEIGELAAKDIMSDYPTTLDPDDAIGMAGDIFLANKYHALPIVKDKKLVGIVTVHDLLAYSFGQAKELMKENEVL